MGIWDDLQKRIRISVQDEHRTPRPKDLDKCEAETGLKLPKSYREFALDFGPGVLHGHHAFEITTPGFRDTSLDLAEQNRQWKTGFIEACNDETIADVYDDVPRLRRLVLFCAVRGWGDQFGWDPSDITVPEDHEYGIYMIPRNGRKIERVAKTFRELIVDFALSGRYERLLFEEQPPEGGAWKNSATISFTQYSLKPDDD